MAAKFEIKPAGLISTIADLAMLPIMAVFTGFIGLAQRTHFWNNRKMTPEERAMIDLGLILRHPGDPTAHRWGGLFAHLPICLGGWRKFIVIEPADQTDVWYVGWVSGVSLIPLKGPVRVLIGRGDAEFVAFNAEGVQIPLKKTGEGQLVTRNPYMWLPLR